MAKYLDENGLLYLWGKIKNTFVKQVSGKGLSTNDYTSAEKNKLAGIAEGANKYVHPSYTAKSSGLYKVTVDGTGHISAAAAAVKADITALGIPGQDTTYGVATTSTNGLMSAEDRVKLGTIANGAEPNRPLSGLAKNGGVITETDVIDGSEPLMIAMVSAGYINVSAEVTKDSNGLSTLMYTIGANIPTASGASAGLMSAADKAKLNAFGAASTYALKSDITAMYRYKGSVADSSKLPATGQTTGDVYNIEAASSYGPAGTNVAWDGSAWDALGGLFEVNVMSNADIDTICV